MSLKADGVLAADWYMDGHGQRVHNIHRPEQCAGRPCTIHNPSQHPMRAFPTLLRIPRPWDIKPLHIERVCPHGVGHPDPDDMEFHVGVRGDTTMLIHGCCGCCNGSYEGRYGCSS